MSFFYATTNHLQILLAVYVDENFATSKKAFKTLKEEISKSFQSIAHEYSSFPLAAIDINEPRQGYFL